VLLDSPAHEVPQAQLDRLVRQVRRVLGESVETLVSLVTLDGPVVKDSSASEASKDRRVALDFLDL